MKRTRFIAFLFGSTALATSMSFLPLADAHAFSLSQSVVTFQETEQNLGKSSLHSIDAILDVQNLKIETVKDSGTTQIDPNLLMSRIAGGYESETEYSSDEETVDIDGMEYELVHEGRYLPRSDSDLDLR
mgnify:FL=1